MNETSPLVTLVNQLPYILSLTDEKLICEHLSRLHSLLQGYVGEQPLENVNEALARTIQESLMKTDFITDSSQILGLLYKIEGITAHLDNLYKNENDCFYKIMNLRKKLLLREILQYASKEKSLLDLGCAEGIFLQSLKGNFKTLYGVDISSERLKRLQKRNSEVTLFCLDLNQDTIPRENATVDIILATEILEHIYNYPHVFREMCRVLKQGGRIIGTIPNKDSLLYMMRKYFLKKKVTSWNHPQMWNLRSFKKTVVAFNLEIEKLHCFGVEVPYVNFIGKIDFLQTTFFRFPLIRNFSTFILFNLLKK